MRDKNTIRNYRNKVWLRFAERGESFTLKVPHHSKWLEILKFLRSRGWQIGENPSYKEHFACLSKYHKIGHKGNVACLMEIGSSSIEIEFGNIKNLWTGIAQSFWDDPKDDRYTQLTYLEGVAVKLEIKKLMDFCSKYNHEFIPEDDSLTPEQYIIKGNQTNSHIHGKVNSLEDIKLSIKEDDYDYRHNSNDRDKKKIICGERKCFYDYSTKRLNCGIVWHHINNMWWVISGAKLRNIASYELFDYVPGTPRREPVSKRKIERLLNHFAGKRDFKKCLSIQRMYETIAA